MPAGCFGLMLVQREGEYKSAAVLEELAASLTGERHIGKACLWMAIQVRKKIDGSILQCALSLRGNGNQLVRLWGPLGLGWRRLLNNQVCVGAPNSEGGDAG